LPVVATTFIMCVRTVGMPTPAHWQGEKVAAGAPMGAAALSNTPPIGARRRALGCAFRRPCA